VFCLLTMRDSAMTSDYQTIVTAGDDFSSLPDKEGGVDVVKRRRAPQSASETTDSTILDKTGEIGMTFEQGPVGLCGRAPA